MSRWNRGGQCVTRIFKSEGKRVGPDVFMAGILESLIAVFSCPWASIECKDSPPGS